MPWYAASAIIYTKFKEGNQDRYPVWENVILIEAESSNEAHKKAIERAKMDEGDASGTYYYDDRPASMVFAGIRKIITCEDSNDRPRDGTEITYSTIEVYSEEDFSKLVNGEPVTVMYEE